jgi:hypothetical protein
MKRRFIQIIYAATLMSAGWAGRAQDTNTNTNANASVNAMTGLDFQSFQIISLRNMFDPYRRPSRTSRDNQPAHRYDYFSLNGTMSYEDKSYAFFEGLGVDRNRAFAPTEAINGYKIVEITNNYVKLLAASNLTVNLSVGMQMKRTDNGPWSLVARQDPNAEPPADAGDGTGPRVEPSVSGADSDVMARLMKRREQEMNAGTITTNENHQ